MHSWYKANKNVWAFFEVLNGFLKRRIGWGGGWGGGGGGGGAQGSGMEIIPQHGSYHESKHGYETFASDHTHCGQLQRNIASL